MQGDDLILVQDDLVLMLQFQPKQVTLGGQGGVLVLEYGVLGIGESELRCEPIHFGCEAVNVLLQGREYVAAHRSFIPRAESIDRQIEHRGYLVKKDDVGFFSLAGEKTGHGFLGVIHSPCDVLVGVAEFYLSVLHNFKPLDLFHEGCPFIWSNLGYCLDTIGIILDNTGRISVISGVSFGHKWVLIFQTCGLIILSAQTKKQGDPNMDNELKSLIVELLDKITDTTLLDLIYKILLESIDILK